RRRPALDRSRPGRRPPHGAPHLLRPATGGDAAVRRHACHGHRHRARLHPRERRRRPLPARAAGAGTRRRCGAEPPAAVPADGRRTMSARSEEARERDAADPLARFRARFALPRDAAGTPRTYLCGHSLGLLPLAARELVSEELDDWARLGVEGHEHARRPWIPYHENLTAGLAALTGAHPDEVVAMNSLPVTLTLMLASFYRPQGPLARIARLVRARGCVLGFDLAHSIGNVPLELHGSDADFAVWCSYKYLNGGPGAIGGCFVNQRHAQAQPRDRHAGALPGARLAGWWSHEEPTRFLMEPQFRASAGAAAWQISNPSVLSAAPLIAALRIFLEAGIGPLRA